MENFFSVSRKIQHPTTRLHNLEAFPKRSALAKAFHYTSSGLCQQQIPNLDGRFTVVWLKSGNVSLIAKGQSTIINASRLFCLLPGHQFQLLSGHDIEAYLISFSEDFLLSTGEQETYPFSMYYGDFYEPCQVIETTGDMQDTLENVMRLASRNFDTNCNFNTEIFKGMLQILAVYFSRGGAVATYRKSSATGDDQLFSAFKKLLDVHYVTKKSVTEYANLLEVTPGCLSDTIKRVSGYTASFFIHQRVIRAAKRAAAGSRSSMKEVAYQVGFTDIAHFSKFFRSQTGINFTDYKKLLV